MLFGSVRAQVVRPVAVSVYFKNAQGKDVLVKQFTAVPGTIVAKALTNAGFRLTTDRRNARFVIAISYGVKSLVGHGVSVPGDELFFWGNGFPLSMGIFAAAIPTSGARIVVGLVRPKGE
jgi:hypothetical protein